jgi:hypothetical protein
MAHSDLSQPIPQPGRRVSSQADEGAWSETAENTGAPRWTTPVILVVVPVAMIVGGIWIHLTSRPFADGVTVTGVVVDVTFSPGDSPGNDDGTWSPVVEYTDPSSGVSYQQVRRASTGDRPDIGDQWEVSFRPDNPEDARVISSRDPWFAAVFVVPGLLIGVIGLVRLARFLL